MISSIVSRHRDLLDGSSAPSPPRNVQCSNPADSSLPTWTRRRSSSSLLHLPAVCLPHSSSSRLFSLVRARKAHPRIAIIASAVLPTRKALAYFTNHNHNSRCALSISSRPTHSSSSFAEDGFSSLASIISPSLNRSR